MPKAPWECCGHAPDLSRRAAASRTHSEGLRQGFPLKLLAGTIWRSRKLGMLPEVFESPPCHCVYNSA